VPISPSVVYPTNNNIITIFYEGKKFEIINLPKNGFVSTAFYLFVRRENKEAAG
jgi:hypothetical protein